MKKDYLKRELSNTNIRSTQSYYSVLSGILEERTGVALDVDVKRKLHKDIVTFSLDGSVVSRLKCTPSHHNRHRSLNEQVNGVSKELSHLLKTVRGKGVC